MKWLPAHRGQAGTRVPSAQHTNLSQAPAIHCRGQQEQGEHVTWPRARLCHHPASSSEPSTVGVFPAYMCRSHPPSRRSSCPNPSTPSGPQRVPVWGSSCQVP